MADEIFDAEELAAEAVQADTPPPAEAPAGDDRPRDEQGRFAPKAEGEDQPVAEETRDEKGNQVPQGALHAERERRKEAEKRWQQADAQLQSIARLREAAASRQPPPLAEPAPEDDAAAQIAYLRDRLARVEGTQTEFARERETEQVDQMERQHLTTALTTAENEFRQATPDYDDAINHVIQARAQELALYGVPPVEIQKHLQQEVLDITRSAIAQGRSPAEVGYQLATLRGYRRAEGGQGEQPQGQAGGAAQVAAIAAAQRGSRSLGQASGAAPAKDLNAQTIASMSQDEFDALYSTPEGKRMIDAL